MNMPADGTGQGGPAPSETPSNADSAMLTRFSHAVMPMLPPDDRAGGPHPDDPALPAAADVAALWDFVQHRPPGAPKLRLAADADGCGVIEIVTDDMPFLVDSVRMALARQGVAVRRHLHPILRIRRDAAGHLLDLVDEAGAGDAAAESVMQIQLGPLAPEAAPRLEAALQATLHEVATVVAAWQPMLQRLYRLAAEAAPQEGPQDGRDETEAGEVGLFLRWLASSQFTFLGARSYTLGQDAARLTPDPRSGLGLLADPAVSAFEGLRQLESLPPDLRAFLAAPDRLLITKSTVRAPVHRPAPMDLIVLKRLDAAGAVVGMEVFLGLFTTAAYAHAVRDIPILRRRVGAVLARAGYPANSHNGKALAGIIDTLPRDELFQSNPAELYRLALAILALSERPRVRLFMRLDPFERYASCLVFVPRERYDSALRQRHGEMLAAAFAGTVDTYSTHWSEELTLVRTAYSIRTSVGAVPAVDLRALERDLAAASRRWADDLAESFAAAGAAPERWREAFPTAYQERFTAREALGDRAEIEAVLAGKPLGLALADAADGRLALKVFHAGQSLPLSDLLPMLEHLGLRVLGEVPYAITVPDGRVALQEFDLLPQPAPADPLLVERPVAAADRRSTFEAALAAIWSGMAESDGFNRLVWRAGLDWREIVVLRTYAKVLRQAGVSFSQSYMEDTLAAYPGIARLLVRLFRRRLDPDRETSREVDSGGLAVEIEHALDRVANLDQDRILRSYVTLIERTLRSNFFQEAAGGGPKPYLSVKLDSARLDLLPAPRPMVEIFVYSPRMEGVHLRGGKVARGGIRWSDRREDFRTEILGLMKAQMVKNAVIVPVGSKGGFVVKNPPPASAGRPALMAEVVECYKTLMRGLLDITDNTGPEGVIPPARTVRRDGDDPYLVVAADKGTATFSDIANGVSQDYGFWLDDAFASGGSAGYDHKAMGITARGAWEAVKRHFREIGTDIQTTDFTVVGVGDMAGDVFGNGMLLSRHIRLRAAFNHQHIFIDPQPNANRSWAERQRLFDKPGSSWADYDTALISAGGGIFERSAKSIPLTPEMRAMLGAERERVPPADLIRLILTMPVDLLWLGGIGTYVKSRGESHFAAGDKANDALRIDGGDLKAKVVGEGANLGFTQLGRIEYARVGNGGIGGRINTDAIDNSAGVDTSDHEVNIKILTGAAIAEGALATADRNGLLAGLTEEVSQHVLRHNYLQTQALTLAEDEGVAGLEKAGRLMRQLEKAGRLDRALEFLPGEEALQALAAEGRGLSRPELSVLLAYAKNAAFDALIASGVPDDPAFVATLHGYFPHALGERFGALIDRHRLRREIVATILANVVVNRMGPFFLSERQANGLEIADSVAAFDLARRIIDADSLWEAVEALDNRVPAARQSAWLQRVATALAAAADWFQMPGRATAIEAGVARYRATVQALASAEMPAGQAEGLPPAIARRLAGLDLVVPALEIAEIAPSPEEGGRVAESYFTLGRALGLDRLRSAARDLDSGSLWQRRAAQSIDTSLAALQGRAVREALAAGSGAESWLDAHKPILAAADAIGRELDAKPDLAMLLVASRRLEAALAAVRCKPAAN